MPLLTNDLWLYWHLWSLGVLVLMAIFTYSLSDQKEFPLDELPETGQEGDAGRLEALQAKR